MMKHKLLQSRMCDTYSLFKYTGHITPIEIDNRTNDIFIFNRLFYAPLNRYWFHSEFLPNIKLFNRDQIDVTEVAIPNRLMVRLVDNDSVLFSSQFLLLFFLPNVTCATFMDKRTEILHMAVYLCALVMHRYRNSDDNNHNLDMNFVKFALCTLRNFSFSFDTVLGYGQVPMPFLDVLLNGCIPGLLKPDTLVNLVRAYQSHNLCAFRRLSRHEMVTKYVDNIGHLSLPSENHQNCKCCNQITYWIFRYKDTGICYECVCDILQSHIINGNSKKVNPSNNQLKHLLHQIPSQIKVLTHKHDRSEEQVNRKCETGTVYPADTQALLWVKCKKCNNPYPAVRGRTEMLLARCSYCILHSAILQKCKSVDNCMHIPYPLYVYCFNNNNNNIHDNFIILRFIIRHACSSAPLVPVSTIQYCKFIKCIGDTINAERIKQKTFHNTCIVTDDVYSTDTESLANALSHINTHEFLNQLYVETDSEGDKVIPQHIKLILHSGNIISNNSALLYTKYCLRLYDAHTYQDPRTWSVYHCIWCQHFSKDISRYSHTCCGFICSYCDHNVIFECPMCLSPKKKMNKISK